MTESRIDIVREAFGDLHRAVSAAGYRGWEFDDYLASPVVRALSLGNLFLKRVWIQVGEKLPMNLRPILGIPKLASTKADGFFARGYLRATEAGDGDAMGAAEARLEALRASVSSGWSGPAWGNAFDFASRGGFFPKGRPTVVWTSHISRAFEMHHEATGDPMSAKMVAGCADFVENDLPRHEDDKGICFGYAPGVLNLVHNSNLLAAVALLRACKREPSDARRELARRAFAWSLADMTPEGGWFYGAEDKYRWMDNFHTGYIIDCMVEARDFDGRDLVPDDALERTVRFWRERFFLGDGTPRYFPERTYPIDIQSAAQAIETFAKLGRLDAESLDGAWHVFDWTRRHMRRPDGFYRYQRRRFWTNDLASIHWGQATMLSAMGEFMAALAESETA